jgi:hypothetical protein
LAATFVANTPPFTPYQIMIARSMVDYILLALSVQLRGNQHRRHCSITSVSAEEQNSQTYAASTDHIPKEQARRRGGQRSKLRGKIAA